MHPKNPFQKDYDFDSLVEHEASLKKHVFVNKHGNKTIKFADKHAVKSLNKALLKSHYGIDWDIPEKNICPPIPGRLEYLLYVADLLKKETATVLDIGTGANLIYPILATCHFKWKCTGTEIDRSSLENAQAIIEQNPALKEVELRLQKSKEKILENVILAEDKFDVVICNPPFFKSAKDAEKSNRRKVRNLKLKEKDNKNFGGRSNELWCEGGEEAFVKQMVKESVQFKKQVKWFTSLISNHEHLPRIKNAIAYTNAKSIRVIEMELGNKKTRFVAWSFR